MRRAVKWLAGAVGLAALARLRSQRPHPAGAPLAPDPAEELRRKLADRRDAEDAPGPETWTGTDVAAVEPETEPAAETDAAEIDRLRAEVHARGQDAIESMRAVSMPAVEPSTGGADAGPA